MSSVKKVQVGQTIYDIDGAPSAYIKSASANYGTLTLTKQDDTEVSFSNPDIIAGLNSDRSDAALAASAGKNLNLSKQNVIQVTEMGAPAGWSTGAFYHYLGQTNANYTHGYFYECVQVDGVYQWQRVDVQPAGSVAAWGNITGTLSSQTDLQAALDGKGTYSKPANGIPSTDMASGVQSSLGKADTAMQPVSGSHADEIATLDSSGNLKASGYKITEREAVSVAAGASAVSLTMAVNKMYTINLTGAASAVTLTLATNFGPGLDQTKENVWAVKVKVPSGTTVTFVWDQNTSLGALTWANDSAPAFTAGKTTEIYIDKGVDANYNGVSTEFADVISTGA